MIIKKILNNNVVISENNQAEELVVMGKGIAFQKKVGDILITESIEKTFVNHSLTAREELERMVERIDPDILEASKEIMLYAEGKSGHDYSEKAYLTLTDHLYYAIERNREGVYVPNPLLFEIKKFYSKEYEIALESLVILEKRLGIRFPEDEAGFIALHLANSITATEDMHVTMESTEIVRDILSIISRYFGLVFDETSLSYHRMVTHIQFFVQRILKHESYDEPDAFLYELVQSKYPEAFHCSLRIRDYLDKTKKISVKDSEVIYLVIHINRVISDTKK